MNRGSGMNLSSACRWCLVSCAVLAFGCAKQQYSECQPPDDHLQILFKAKSGTNPFGHSFCIVCNPSLEPDEYVEWAREMGANENPEMNTPCLYVYGAAELGLANGYESLAQCQTAVCDGGGTYADFVSRQNGNIDLGPILDPDREQ